MTELDATHDPARHSWVSTAVPGETDFPLQNLPLGMVTPVGGGARPGVAIGDAVLDLAAVAEGGLLVEARLTAAIGQASAEGALNRVLALPAELRRSLRARVSDLLAAGGEGEGTVGDMLLDADDCTFGLPARTGSFTDFYAGIHHARAAMEALTGEGGLPPNYLWVPIAYQSRASTLRASGAEVPRPSGQRRPDPDADPEFGPSEWLDYELELGVYVGEGSVAGSPLAMADAAERIAGFCLLNDWSARDIQFWEMTPLGPFLSKSFATTVSSWIVSPEALAPFRTPAMDRGEAPAPLPYLLDADDQAAGGLDIELSVTLGEAPIARSNARHLYWTPAQMLAHHTSNGCNLETGDLIGTGTISGPVPAERSSLLELTMAGREPIGLPDGERRSFLEDGDTVTFRGRCERAGAVPIGFGPCTGTVVPS